MSRLEAIPRELEQEGGRLLDVAMWCIGQDVRHPDGNLLVRRGCARDALPKGSVGTSAYSAALAGGATLTLWGFGALLVPAGRAQAVFFERALLRPQLVNMRHVSWPLFETAALGPLRPPVDVAEARLARLSAAALAAWLSEYEAWLAGEVGTAYRSSLLARRHKRPPCSAEALPQAWQRLAVRLLSTTEALEAPRAEDMS